MAKSEITARKFLEAKSDVELARIAEPVDPYLPVSAATRADLEWNARTAGEILAARSV